MIILSLPRPPVKPIDRGYQPATEVGPEVGVPSVLVAAWDRLGRIQGETIDGRRVYRAPIVADAIDSYLARRAKGVARG